jgi:CheY-like chemotaxis protein
MTENKKSILVIEDDAEVRSMLEDYLTYLGYEVFTAEDGLEGLKKIKSGRYDLVITDIAMPYVSGIGIISILKEEHPEIPVMAVTGYGYHAEELANEKNANAIVSKPFDIQEIKNLIEDLLAE